MLKSFNKNIAAMGAVAQSSVVAVRLFSSVPPTGESNYVNTLPLIGIATGYEYTYNGKKYIEVTTSRAFSFKNLRNNGSVVSLNYGYLEADKIRLLTPTSAVKGKDGKELLKALNANDAALAKSLNLSQLVIKSLERKGVNVSKEKSILQDLQKRIITRRAKIEKSGLVVFKEVPSTWNQFKNKLGLGELATGTLIAIVAGVSIAIGAGLAYVLYFAFKPEYDASTADLRVSDSLRKALDTLSPSERLTVVNDLENQVDKAFNHGKEKEAFGSLLNFKVPLLIAVSLIGFKAVNSSLKNGKN